MSSNWKGPLNDLPPRYFQICQIDQEWIGDNVTNMSLDQSYRFFSYGKIFCQVGSPVFWTTILNLWTTVGRFVTVCATLISVPGWGVVLQCTGARQCGSHATNQCPPAAELDTRRKGIQLSPWNDSVMKTWNVLQVLIPILCLKELYMSYLYYLLLILICFQCTTS